MPDGVSSFNGCGIINNILCEVNLVSYETTSRMKYTLRINTNLLRYVLNITIAHVNVLLDEHTHTLTGRRLLTRNSFKTPELVRQSR